MQTRLVLCVVLATAMLSSPSPAAAKPTPVTEVLVARWSAHLNRHGRGHRYASDRHVTSRVRLELRRGGRAVVVDAGQRKHSSLNRGAYQSELTRWTSRWTGTWKRAGEGRLSLALRRATSSCQRVLGRRRAAETSITKTNRPCPKAARRLELTCRAVTVQAAPPDLGPPKTPTSDEPAWRCTPRVNPSFGSSAPWVFGKRRCLEQYTMRRIRYRVCTPRAKPVTQ